MRWRGVTGVLPQSRIAGGRRGGERCRIQRRSRRKTTRMKITRPRCRGGLPSRTSNSAAPEPPSATSSAIPVRELRSRCRPRDLRAFLHRPRYPATSASCSSLPPSFTTMNAAFTSFHPPTKRTNRPTPQVRRVFYSFTFSETHCVTRSITRIKGTMNF